MRLHEEIQFKCDDCEATFAIEKDLKTHTANLHEEKNKTLRCIYCTERFSNVSGFKKHILSVHEGKIVPEMIHHCHICDFTTKYKEYMKRHIESIHEGKKPYHCLICDSKFALKPNFTAHVAVVHEGKKTKICEMCDKSFSRNKDLKKHRALDHQVKKCALCEFEATSIIAMETHRKSVHEEITESSARGRPENMSELIQSLLKAQVLLPHLEKSGGALAPSAITK